MKRSTKFTIITVLVLLGLVIAYAYNRHLTNLANREEVARQKAINIYLRRDSSILDYQLEHGQKIRSADENYYDTKNNGRLKEMDNHGIVPYVEQALQETKGGGTFAVVADDNDKYSEIIESYKAILSENETEKDREIAAKGIIEETFTKMEVNGEKIPEGMRSYLLGKAKAGQSFESFTAKQLDQMGEVLEHLPVTIVKGSKGHGTEEFIRYLDQKYQ